MRDPEDIVDVSGVHAPKPASGTPSIRRGRPGWKSVLFECCHVYGRMYRNAESTRYEGACPRCGATVHALIGPGGTNRSIFTAH